MLKLGTIFFYKELDTLLETMFGCPYCEIYTIVVSWVQILMYWLLSIYKERLYHYKKYFMDELWSLETTEALTFLKCSLCSRPKGRDSRDLSSSSDDLQNDVSASSEDRGIYIPDSISTPFYFRKISISLFFVYQGKHQLDKTIQMREDLENEARHFLKDLVLY